ncbi:MAG: RNA polymerase sigma factor [Acidimicrobiales bacterium]
MSDKPRRQHEDRLEQLWREHLPPLVLYAMRRCASREDALDVVAEVYLVAWRRIERVPAGSEARLWLFTVARNVLANHRRGQVRRTRLAKRLALEVEVTVPVATEVSDAALALEAALGVLSEPSRELLVLVAQDGLSVVEAAGVLGISAPTARVRLHRVRAQLRKEMQRLGADGHMEVAGPTRASGAENLEVI